MSRFLVLFVILNVSLGFSVGFAENQTFGTKPTLQSPTSLNEVLKNYSKYENKELLLSGRTGKVCEKKGCWMVLIDGSESIRVTFKDYGFFIPKDSAGKQVTAQGQIQRKVESVKEQKHYLKDAGAPAEDIEKIKSEKESFSFVATGVSLAGSGSPFSEPGTRKK